MPDLHVALSPPRAWGEPPAEGRIRVEPEDFLVEEELGFAPSGAGSHLLLKVRKRNANTQWVAKQLAELGGCRAADVGYAGLKDRRAVAVQWFSVPAGRSTGLRPGAWGEGFEILEAHAHSRKLPRGALAGNVFTIRVRDAVGETARIDERVALLAARGVPNYFGPQRFGRDGANLTRIQSDPRRLRPGERGFVLSAARSLIFNAILAERVREGTWERLEPGDIANLDGRGSIFPVEQADEALQARAARLAIHPTGALWGAGEPPSRGRVRELEIRVAQRFPSACALLAAAGMAQERRALRLAVRDLACERDGGDLILRFRLTRGAFATTVLRELLRNDVIEEDVQDSGAALVGRSGGEGEHAG